MKLSKKISTNPWFTRSKNLTRDIGSEDSIASYVLTSSTKRSLEAIHNGFEALEYSRAWTLIGPYGSGKSSFGLFLDALTSHDELKSKALNKVKAFDLDLHEKISKTFSAKNICSIVLSGSYDLLEVHLAEAIFVKVKQLEQSSNISKELINDVTELKKTENPKAIEIIRTIKKLQIDLRKNKFDGLFITIDELGKFIEFAGAKKKDIFLLQELAELSVEKNDVPLFFIGMLHQKLEYYAQNLNIEIKNEWKKIQGRFEEIPFIESTEQMIRILGEAINTSYSSQDLSKIRTNIKNFVYYFLDSKFFPNLVGKKPTLNLFAQAYPLHPASSALLPILAQKLGQNERTIFTYLGSNEAYGFQEQIEQKESHEFIMPADIFDYFYTNQSSYINDHVVNKRWLEILNSLDRLNEDEIELVNLLKTIGLINLVGAFSSLKCTKDFLSKIFDNDKLAKMLATLESKSLIIYRKFNNEYRIWQGSDFDFESSIRNELDQLHSFDLASDLNEILPAKPLLARRFSIKNGTLRYFASAYASAENIDQFLAESATTNPLALIVFEDSKTFSEEQVTNIQANNKNILIIKIKDSDYIVSEAKQLRALKNLSTNSDLLASDPIARAEVLSQISQSQKKIESELKKLFQTDNAQWYFAGQPIAFTNEIDLQVQLSEILESIFCYSPTINNELINKDDISKPAQSARINLMKDMLTNTALHYLGYPDEQAPPQKGMFKAIFLDNELVDTSNGVCFINPKKDTNFDKIYKLIETTLSKAEKPVSFTELSDLLNSPPFGLKRGLHPIIFLAFYFANEENVAIYEDNLFRPYFNAEAIERLVRKSPNFSFKFHSFSGQGKLIKKYENILAAGTKDKDALSIVRRLSKIMSVLPDYTLSTQSALSKEAIKFRAAFLYSKSPIDLLTKDIPFALGFNSKDLNTQEDLEKFSKALNKVLSELKSCYVNLILEQKEKFCFAFDLDGSKEFAVLRPILYDKLVMLEDYAIDTKSTKPFIKKILDKENSDQKWFESLLSFLVKKHPMKWSDDNVTEAEIELKNISDKIKDLTKLRVYESNKNIPSAHDLDIYVMRIKKKGFDEKDVITTLSASERGEYEKFKKEILKILVKYSNNTEDQISLLSPLVDDILNGKVSQKDILKIVKNKK